ncbi:hypothetical protein TruAng_006492 [Truncatella angustata]|nr:hypothetical protein TruAng_006492 [Truncatella angustata]
MKDTTPPIISAIAVSKSLLLDSLHDRVTGVLVGAALGDAIGLYTEFLSAEHSAFFYPARQFILAPDGYDGKGPTRFRVDTHRMKHLPGDWTDDTDHALLLLLAALRNVDASISDADLVAGTTADFPPRLKIWVDCGLRALDKMPLGLGKVVASVVRSHTFVTDPEGTARKCWESSGKRSASNGSLMRTHPLGLLALARDEEVAFALGAAVSKTTHADPRCVIACAIGSALIRGVVRGDIDNNSDLDSVITRALVWFATQEQPSPGYKLDVAELKKHTEVEGLDSLKLDDSQGMGYVYKTLGAGVFLLRSAIKVIRGGNPSFRARLSLFENLITDLVMHGGDADTNACFAGALIGGYLGFKALPQHWWNNLRHGDWLISKAEALCQVLGITSGDYDAKGDSDTLPDGGRGILNQEQMDIRWNHLMTDVEQRLRQRKESSKTSDVPSMPASEEKRRQWFRRNKVP